MADLIVKAAVKEALDDKNVSSDFYGALDDEVTELLDRRCPSRGSERSKDGAAPRPVTRRSSSSIFSTGWRRRYLTVVTRTHIPAHSCSTPPSVPM